MTIATEIQILDPTSGLRIAHFTYDRPSWQGQSGEWRNVPFNPHPSETDPLRIYADHLIGLGFNVRLITSEVDPLTDAGEARVY